MNHHPDSDARRRVTIFITPGRVLPFSQISSGLTTPQPSFFKRIWAFVLTAPFTVPLSDPTIFIFDWQLMPFGMWWESYAYEAY